jgi:hypothetical protein
MNRRFILAIILLMIAGLMMAWHLKSSSGQSSGPSRSYKSSWLLAGDSADSEKRDVDLGTKSKIRASLRKKPTVEETRKLVGETMIPAVDLPPQTLRERFTGINRLIRECGIGTEKLKLVIDDEGAPPDRPPLAGLICRDPLRVRDIPLFHFLQYTVDNFAFRYEIVAGRVDFFWHGSIRAKLQEDRTIQSVNSGDPFAAPDSTASPKEEESDSAADPFREK